MTDLQVEEDEPIALCEAGRIESVGSVDVIDASPRVGFLSNLPIMLCDVMKDCGVFDQPPKPA